MTFTGGETNATTRRRFFQTSGLGLASGTLASWLGSKASAADRETAKQAALGVRPPHFPARAKNVIFLQMCGAPSQIDLFDEKPELNMRHDQAAPESLYKGKRFAFIEGAPKLLGCPYKFRQHGRSGGAVSELLPQTASIVDELCIIKSMHTDLFNHAPAQIFMTSGSGVFGRPSMGSWVLSGLGSESKNLPGFVVLVPGSGVSGGKALWHNGFIPAEFQGTQFRTAGEPVLFVNNPPGVDRARRRMTIDAIRELNKIRTRQIIDPQIEARTSAYEMAHEMQTSIPNLANLASEPQHILDMYGAQPGQNTFANACLMARRLVESGVRFVQICFKGHDGKGIWDSHGEAKHSSLEHGLPYVTRQVDRPSAALVADLKQRGLLDDTLVIWGGEFGRTCLNENRAGKAIYMGRDHWPNAFTMWLAGGGIRAGMTYGATDAFSYNVVEKPVHVHDLQATILHCLGIDHERLTYRFQGRHFRLTDVHGKVVHEILA